MTHELIFVLNGKGGVGKSFFASNLLPYLRQHSDRCIAVDTDNENSTLKRFHPDAEFISIEQPRCIDRICSLLESASHVVVDGRAASTDLLLRYFSELDLIETLSALDASLTVCVPINHEPDSIEQLRLLDQQLPQSARFVVVKNQSHSKSFQIYEQSQTRAALIKNRNAIEIVMPAMHDWLVTALQRYGLTPVAAQQHPSISLLDRQRLRHWQHAFHAELVAAFPPGEECATTP